MVDPLGSDPRVCRFEACLASPVVENFCCAILGEFRCVGWGYFLHYRRSSSVVERRPFRSEVASSILVSRFLDRSVLGSIPGELIVVSL
jgi:hypothetical protein